MNYSQALKFTLKKQSLGVKPGLSRVKALLKKMGNPQDKMKIIHIAGTNGKGTIAATIARALKNRGFNTGLFMSPWVVDYREQIQLNGEFISEERFAEYVTDWQEDECTEFEFLTAIMYKYFADSGVDYAVVECGLGGAGDATNVEKRNLSVITSISLDHIDVLGTTVEDIAREKSGIMRKDCACVLYPSELNVNLFMKKCSKLIQVTDTRNTDLNNLNTAKAVMRELGLNDNIELCRLPARQERINGVLLDGGHNLEAARKLEALLTKEVAVIGMMKDKDVEGYLSLIAPKCRTIVVTAPDNPRSMRVDELADIAEDYCDNVYIIDKPSDAVKIKNLSLVCGSFYLAREVRNLLLAP